MTATDITFNRISYDRFLADIETVAQYLEADSWKPDFIVGIGRGGLVPGTFLSHRTGISQLSIDHSSKIHAFAEALLVHLATLTHKGERYLFVDDINDTGKTIGHLRGVIREMGIAENVRFAVLVNNIRSAETVDYASWTIDRQVDKDWIVFPWESVASQETLVEEAQEDPDRLGLPKA
ncbi:MAG: phosphoribosyltransferase domain-containing protein [Sphingobium sp.]